MRVLPFCYPRPTIIEQLGCIIAHQTLSVNRDCIYIKTIMIWNFCHYQKTALYIVYIVRGEHNYE